MKNNGRLGRASGNGPGPSQIITLSTQSLSLAGGGTRTSFSMLGLFFFSSRRRHTILTCDWSSDVSLPISLGLKVEVFDENARPVKGQKGELVCTRPFPSLPIGFWNDPGGTKYRAAYFDRFPGVWTHGDWCEITLHEGMIIYGRSDAVLNPGGVRIGTAEIYRQVEQLDEVVESLVIGQTWPPGEIGDVRVVLFVKLREGLALDDALIAKI